MRERGERGEGESKQERRKQGEILKEYFKFEFFECL